MDNARKFYIDGVWVDPVTPVYLDVIAPSTEEAFEQTNPLAGDGGADHARPQRTGGYRRRSYVADDRHAA